MVWDAVLRVLAAQHGLITRGQLLGLGATDGWIRWAVTDGRLKRYRTGVYGVVGSPASPFHALMAATLAAGTAAAASHMSAAWLWGAEHVAQGPPELTTFACRANRLPGVLTHRSSLDPDGAIKRRHGIPTVVPALTIVQLASTRTPLFVERVANDLVRSHFTNFREILMWIDTVGGGRHKELRGLCVRALEVGGHDDSPAARRLGEAMIAANVPKFETDYRVATPEGDLLLDFAWPAPKVGLEYNGFRDHATRVGFDNDARRLCRLTALGWRILQCTSGITHREVVHWVLAALASDLGCPPLIAPLVDGLPLVAPSR
jgi:hypothetical protein